MEFLGNCSSKQLEQGRDRHLQVAEKDVMEVKLMLAWVTGWEEFCSRHRTVGAKKQLGKHHVCVRNWTGLQRGGGEVGEGGAQPWERQEEVEQEQGCHWVVVATGMTPCCPVAS